jgi:transcriptional regulator with XRE-family HTH domain
MPDDRHSRLCLERHKSSLTGLCHVGTFGRMTLAAWMRNQGIADEDLAATLGIDRSTVSRLRRGRKIPSTRLMEKIAQATDGAVTPNDFFDLTAAKDAA